MGDNGYFWMKALHEIVALWLAAGVFGSVVLRAHLKRSGDTSGYALLSRLHTVFSVPGVILAGILGFALLGIRKFGFNLGWVQGSLALYLVLLVSILFIQLPALRRARTGGTPGKLAGMLPHIDATLIVILVILMAVKPSF
ncbi:MAG TPA: hypothetical protein VNM67_20975 [Thermoanaerobaculia bacterium]|jgi:uncharacterized membrane protein|nr:hypothetical protein [Thermoanaerobaculia bacterium]